MSIGSRFIDSTHEYLETHDNKNIQTTEEVATRVVSIQMKRVNSYDFRHVSGLFLQRSVIASANCQHWLWSRSLAVSPLFMQFLSLIMVRSPICQEYFLHYSAHLCQESAVLTPNDSSRRVLCPHGPELRSERFLKKSPSPTQLCHEILDHDIERQVVR